MQLTTVYYSRFWYSRFLNLPPDELDGRFMTGEVDSHLKCFRLLAIFFENIYIPRTHLLTETVPVQSEISAVVLASRDAAFLHDIGTLRVSLSPQLDGEADNERISNRSAFTTAVTYASDRKYLKHLANALPLSVQPGKEAANNTITFPEYAKWLQLTSPELSRKVIAVIDKSQIRDVPFFHESFIHELKRNLTQDEFDKVWRETNSLYLTTAEPVKIGGIPYFNDSIESLSYRYDPFDLDRYLFHPASLYTFLEAVIGTENAALLLALPIEAALECLTVGGYGSWFVKPFREEYLELAAKISTSTKSPFRQDRPNQTMVAGWFDRALSGNLASRVALLEGVVSDAGTIGQAINPSNGVVKRIGESAIRYGKGPLERFMRAKRHAAFYNFGDVLRTTIKQRK